MLHSHLLTDTVQLAADDQVLILNSAADPFVRVAAQQLSAGIITLAEDNIAALQGYQGLPVPQTGFPTPCHYMYGPYHMTAPQFLGTPIFGGFPFISISHAIRRRLWM